MSNINVANINFNKITRICFYFTDMFGKEAVKLITELDMHEDIRPFNVSTNTIQILSYYRYNHKVSSNLQEQVMRQVFEEMQTLYEANLVDRYIICHMAFTKVLLHN